MATHEWAVGETVMDTSNARVGEVMGSEGPYVQLRPVGGGREWDARPTALRPATRDERLVAGVRTANARARGELA
jgi:hypothetical protein